MIRSLLFVPADSRRKLEKSLTSSADALIFDLEDSVAANNKPQGRACLAEFLALERSRIAKKVFVRVNDLTTGATLDDLVATIQFRPDGYVLPKSRNGQDVATLSLYLDALERALPVSSGSDSASAQIIAIATETASSIFGLGSYRGVSPRLWGLMWGAEDLSADIGAFNVQRDGQWSSTFSLVRSMCLLAAADAGVVAIDAVSAEIGNLDRLRDETRQSKRDGFDARAAIHPGQVDAINDGFTPSLEEVEWARQVTEAFETGENGVATLNGRMLDRPHLRLATRILASMT